MKFHPVFHVSMLKPYHADKEDSSRSKSTRAPMGVFKGFDREPEAILDDRWVHKGGKAHRKEFLVHWKGSPRAEASWESLEALWEFPHTIEAYEQARATGSSPD